MSKAAKFHLAPIINIIVGGKTIATIDNSVKFMICA